MRFLVIGLLVMIHLFETAVTVLNQKHSRQPVPENVRDIYDERRYQNWLAYSLEGHRFNLVQGGFGLVVSVILLLGPFAWLANKVSLWATHPILQSLIFLGIFQTFMLLLSLPFGAYRTFSLEERHGFNRSTKGIFLKDALIGYLLTLILGGVILGTIHALFLRFSDRVWLFVFVTWAALAIVIIFAVAFLGKWLMRLFNKFTPLSEGQLRTQIEELGSSLGFDVKAIFVMDASKRSSKSNAAFTGIGRTREVILFDTLLEKMSDDEILAVLSHELGHAVNRDTWRILVQQIVVMGLYAMGIGLILQAPTLFIAFGFSGIHFGFGVIVFSVLAEPLALLLGIPLNYLSRKAEYKADNFASEKTSADAMISALKALSRENLVNLNPHPLAIWLYYSHPPMSERIAALQFL